MPKRSIEAREMRNLFTVQVPHRTTNEVGERPVTWSDQCELWGALRPASVREVEAAGQVKAAVTHVARFRFTDQVTPERRLKLGARLFNVVGAVDEDEQHRFLKVTCVEQIGGG